LAKVNTFSEMATNSSVLATLVAQPIPADLACYINANQLAAIAQCLAIYGLAALVGGPGVVPTNNTASQALAIANQALTAANAAAANIPIMRGSTTPVPLVAGSNLAPISFTDVGTSNYSLIITFVGPNADPGGHFGYNIVSGSQTSTGCQIAFYSIPSGWSFNWQLVTLTNTTAG
jgi:hypothetical protein